jgi:uncharacterized RDD family membrane protein YckC
MKYAGFWRRLIAYIIDASIVGVFAFIVNYFTSSSKLLTTYLSAPQTIISCLYYILLHARSGQTIGKQVVDIKVVNNDGSDIGLKRSFIRYSVPFTLSLALAVGNSIAYLKMNDSMFANGAAGFLSSEYRLFSKFLTDNNPFSKYTIVLLGLWFIGSLISLIASEKKKALHDYQAKTVAIIHE